MNTNQIDIKTVIQLLVDNSIDSTTALRLIAQESNVEYDVLETRLEEIFKKSLSSRGRFTKEEIDVVIDMWRNGATKGEIAKATNRKHASIVNLINRLRRQGVELPSRPLEHLFKNNTNPDQLTLF